ncbi:MAG: Eco57I restriction-modification methylase domain-containing protein [Phycisphaerales bacterium]|jgi:adenine-specific DNA-methyltransferase|nr:Eco57I restriction-modification methylase domain-containing protein [Phycisphaerales bacterium]
MDDSRPENEDAGLVASVVRRTAGYISATDEKDRKAIAQVFTPASVARFMAGRVLRVGDEFTFVDAGAGVGVLAAALCERIAAMPVPRRVVAELYETDPNVLPVLRQTIAECRKALSAAGHHLNATIIEEDFVLRRPAASLYAPVSRTCYADAVIMNPPYAKLAKDSPQARAFAEIVHGQPNVYALFMAAAVELLRPGGELVAITPRSYCNGLYFREFRRWLLARMSLRHIHVFESRRATFKDSEVLQESIITVATKQTEQAAEVLLGVSHGAEMDEVRPLPHAPRTIIDDLRGDCVIRLPADSSDLEIMRVVESWTGTFADRGLRISTGPVVAFRARDYLLDSADHPDAVPLISIHNVRPFATVWPVTKGSKPIAFRVANGAVSQVLPARNYVLLRRFSAKEEHRRLTASPYLPNAVERRRPVALENHINYVTHTTRELTEDEVNGLVALFNSALLDRYFRVVSGNTQVNATEIRSMPFPDLRTIRRIGKHVAGLGRNDRDGIESRVLEVLGVPPSLLAADSEVGA